MSLSCWIIKGYLMKNPAFNSLDDVRSTVSMVNCLHTDSQYLYPHCNNFDWHINHSIQPVPKLKSCCTLHYKNFLATTTTNDWDEKQCLMELCYVTYPYLSFRENEKLQLQLCAENLEPAAESWYHAPLQACLKYSYQAFIVYTSYPRQLGTEEGVDGH